MSTTLVALFSAIGGAVVAGVSSILVVLYETERRTRLDRRKRAFEQHLSQYEEVFVAARSAEEALSDYLRIAVRRRSQSDPFLEMLLEITRSSFRDYWLAVDWRHHPGMVYLDARLEARCLYVAELMQKWLAMQRLSYGNVANLVRDGRKAPIEQRELKRVSLHSYNELRVEKRLIVRHSQEDADKARVIVDELRRVVRELRKVISY